MYFREIMVKGLFGIQIELFTYTIQLKYLSSEHSEINHTFYILSTAAYFSLDFW